MTPTLPTSSGKPFCEVSSIAPDHSSNLQFFSLQQAYRYWDELQAQKPSLTSHQITEYLVFIVVCAGTSVSQLLGQNATHSKGEFVASPKKLFPLVFGPTNPRHNEFAAFNAIYEDCRHFGSPKYQSIATISEDSVSAHLELVVGLWDELVNKYRDDGNDPDGLLVEFESVLDFVKHYRSPHWTKS